MAFVASQAAAAGELLKPLDVAPSSRTPGAPVLDHPYGVPPPREADVVHRSARAWSLPGAASSMTPLADLYGTITPNGLVYERHHGGVPDIDADQHHLTIHGLVRTPKLFTMDDLLRQRAESRIHFLEYSGNMGSEWNGPSGLPVQLTHGLLSCCEWTGVRLRHCSKRLAAFRPEGGQPHFAAVVASWPCARGAEQPSVFAG